VHKNLRVLSKNKPTPEEHKTILYHFFNVNNVGCRKARVVAGGQKVCSPKEDTYSGVVYLKAIRMGLIMVHILRLLVCASDEGIVFLYRKIKEQVYVTAKKKFWLKIAKKNCQTDIFSLTNIFHNSHPNIHPCFPLTQLIKFLLFH